MGAVFVRQRRVCRHEILCETHLSSNGNFLAVFITQRTLVSFFVVEDDGHRGLCNTSLPFFVHEVLEGRRADLIIQQLSMSARTTNT